MTANDVQTAIRYMGSLYIPEYTFGTPPTSPESLWDTILGYRVIQSPWMNG